MHWNEDPQPCHLVQTVDSKIDSKGQRYCRSKVVHVRHNSCTCLHAHRRHVAEVLPTLPMQSIPANHPSPFPG